MPGKRKYNEPFAKFALKTININNSEDHPLNFLVDQETGKFLARKEDATEPSVQVGHGTSRHSGVKELLSLEDASFNQWSNQCGETQKFIFEKSSVLIGDVPVELRTAQMWENLG